MHYYLQYYKEIKKETEIWKGFFCFIIQRMPYVTEIGVCTSRDIFFLYVTVLRHRDQYFCVS